MNRLATLTALQVLMVVMGEKGRMSAVVERPLQIAVPVAAVDTESHWLYTHKMIFRRGVERLGVGVQDELSGIVTYLSRKTETGTHFESR